MKRRSYGGALVTAKVLKPVIETAGFHIIAMIDRNSNATPIIPGCPVFTSLEDLQQWQSRDGHMGVVDVLREALLGRIKRFISRSPLVVTGEETGWKSTTN